MEDLRHFQKIMATIKNYLPTIVTMGNLACGFGAIVFIINNELAYAAWLVILAMVFDGLDGQVARLTKTTIAWGAHLDACRHDHFWTCSRIPDWQAGSPQRSCRSLVCMLLLHLKCRNKVGQVRI